MKQPFYSSEILNDHITIIRSVTGEIMYLVEGTEKTALIDTCLGVGHLREFVSSLTNKPLIVIVTHGHVDHAMGAPEFDEVYMSHKDNAIFLRMSMLEIREEYIASSLGQQAPLLLETDYVKPSVMDFHDLKEGDCFDLGGIHLDIYALPGHTRGSMVILLREERILILGDACNNFTFLIDEDSLSVEAYQNCLKRIETILQGKYDRVFLSHHDMEADVNLISNVVAVCQDIMDENADDIPHKFRGQVNYIAKAIDKNRKRIDGLNGNILYNKEWIQ